MAGPPFSLEGDTSGLPETTRSGIPYEMEALTPKETWGAGNGNLTFSCRQLWPDSTDWIKDMVGTVGVTQQTTPPFQLLRNIPEAIQYNDGRTMFCTIIDQIDQGGNPDRGGALALLAVAGTNWPAAAWYRARAVFEAMPYAVLTDAQMGVIADACGAFAGADELYRYVIRTRSFSHKEQNTPSPNLAANLGYFFVDDVTPANRKPVPGAYINRPIIFGDVVYKWVRVPVGWPPPQGWTPRAGDNYTAGLWPPLVNPVGVSLDLSPPPPPAPSPAQRARDAYIGSVNSVWFDAAAPDGGAYPPGTLQYTGYDDSNKYFDAAGDWVCDVMFKFKFKGGIDATGAVGGWNFVMDASGVWRLITADNAPGDGSHGTSGGRALYKAKDFNDLFQYT